MARALKRQAGVWMDQSTLTPYPPPDAAGRQHQPLAQLAVGDTYEDGEGRVWTVQEIINNPDGTAQVRATG